MDGNTAGFASFNCNLLADEKLNGGSFKMKAATSVVLLHLIAAGPIVDANAGEPETE